GYRCLWSHYGATGGCGNSRCVGISDHWFCPDGHDLWADWRGSGGTISYIGALYRCVTGLQSGRNFGSFTRTLYRDLAGHALWLQLCRLLYAFCSINIADWLLICLFQIQRLTKQKPASPSGVGFCTYWLKYSPCTKPASSGDFSDIKIGDQFQCALLGDAQFFLHHLARNQRMTHQHFDELR